MAGWCVTRTISNSSWLSWLRSDLQGSDISASHIRARPLIGYRTEPGAEHREGSHHRGRHPSENVGVIREGPTEPAGSQQPDGRVYVTCDPQGWATSACRPFATRTRRLGGKLGGACRQQRPARRRGSCRPRPECFLARPMPSPPHAAQGGPQPTGGILQRSDERGWTCDPPRGFGERTAYAVPGLTPIGRIPQQEGEDTCGWRQWWALFLLLRRKAGGFHGWRPQLGVGLLDAAKLRGGGAGRDQAEGQQPLLDLRSAHRARDGGIEPGNGIVRGTGGSEHAVPAAALDAEARLLEGWHLGQERRARVGGGGQHLDAAGLVLLQHVA